MRAVIQRVMYASVSVDDKIVGEIDKGLLVLLGVEQGDGLSDAVYTAEKVATLRIFNDQDGKMNLSTEDIGGQVLAVSQFTLSGDCRRGRRPSFASAAPPAEAVELYKHFINCLKERGIFVAEGVFQAKMQVRLCNDGPVTILLDSKKNF